MIGIEKVERDEDESGKSIDSARKDEGKDASPLPGTTTIKPTDQTQKQEPTLLVTDSWRLANKCMVVAELSMPPSQESSSDSVFTDPEELAANAAKEEAAKAPSITGIPPKNQRIEPSSISPLFGKSFSKFSLSLNVASIREYEMRSRETKCFEVSHPEESKVSFRLTFANILLHILKYRDSIDQKRGKKSITGDRI